MQLLKEAKTGTTWISLDQLPVLEYKFEHVQSYIMQAVAQTKQ